MNRTYVSPGVYTFETELRATYQSLGLTTSAVVGETLKGRAFEPMEVKNYSEFISKFGGQNPTLMTDSTNKVKYPKYELPYVAKSYLKVANSLFVTRVLGLSGYDAGESHLILIGGVLVAVLRFRAVYDGTGLKFKSGVITINDTTLTKIGDDFTIKIGAVSYKVSLDKSKPNYISKVFGNGNFDGTTEVYVEGMYDSVCQSAFLDSTNTKKVTITKYEKTNHNYKTQFKSSITPWVVSEDNGESVEKLFRFVTLSDGANSSTEVKFSIVDVDTETKTFSVLVRDFYDSDDAPIIRERFSGCTLDESSKNYIGRKIGTNDGVYTVKSKYIAVEVNSDINIALFTPSGFVGYPVYDKVNLPLKTSYLPMDNKRKVFLGMSSLIGIDANLLKFMGESTTLKYTNGFIFGTKSSLKIEGVAFEFTPSEITNVSEKKFTFVASGGFDGWDIYRTFRTNEDAYAKNKFYGADASNLTKLGLADRKMSNGADGLNSDYYAYLEGVRTFANPEDIDINVMAVLGLDFERNSALMNEIVDIVEYERADSILIMTAPNLETDEEVADSLVGSGVVSSYTATYSPWKQYSDNENGVYINISPTMDVMRNIAVVDKKNYSWFAVAGTDRGKVECVKVRSLTKPQNELLLSKMINPIQHWTNKGTFIWGNKTLHKDNDSALSSLNIRRMILEARKLIASASLKLVFDQNDNQIRSEFLNMVNPILENIRKERGLTEFRVEVDYSTESIQRRELNARILIKPTPALEFIIIEFGVSDQGVNFDNV